MNLIIFLTALTVSTAKSYDVVSSGCYNNSINDNSSTVHRYLDGSILVETTIYKSTDNTCLGVKDVIEHSFSSNEVKQLKEIRK